MKQIKTLNLDYDNKVKIMTSDITIFFDSFLSESMNVFNEYLKFRFNKPTYNYYYYESNHYYTDDSDKAIASMILGTDVNNNYDRTVKTLMNISSVLNSGRHNIVLIYPETGLHPTAQSLLGEYLTKVTDNIHIITNSEYLLSGIQIGYKKSKLRDVSINFITKTDNSYDCEIIQLNEIAEFDKYPKGFLDYISRFH